MIRTGKVHLPGNKKPRKSGFSFWSHLGTNGTGELKSLTDGAGATTTFYVNGLNGWTIAQDDALGVRTYYERDTLGRVIEESCRARTRARPTSR